MRQARAGEPVDAHRHHWAVVAPANTARLGAGMASRQKNGTGMPALVFWSMSIATDRLLFIAASMRRVAAPLGGKLAAHHAARMAQAPINDRVVGGAVHLDDIETRLA
jgi:hypothetical protein